jgi:hypothetical protein
MKRKVAFPFHRTTRLEAAALRHITQAKRLRNSHMSWISMSRISSDSTNPHQTESPTRIMSRATHAKQIDIGWDVRNRRP